jgi:hypothetical protein
VPWPWRGDKFFRDVDTVVCAFPALPEGSAIERYQYVSVVGYGALLNRLQQPGPGLAWSNGDWDAFCRHLNLYRADEDSREGVLRRAGAAAVDEYCARPWPTVSRVQLNTA